MDDILLLEAVERYLAGDMKPEEKAWFEQLRENTPEVDQLVVEHKLFLHQMNDYAGIKALKTALHESHNRLLERGEISDGTLVSTGGKVIQLFHRYKRVTAIAASIAGLVAITISGMVAYFAPNASRQQLQMLGTEMAKLKKNQQYQNDKLRAVESKIPAEATLTGGGSGFMIDPKGYIITNAHVIGNSNFAAVVNHKGEEYKARIVSIDADKDLAILKIDDADFASSNTLPYTLQKKNTDLGETVFTLGYPRNEIVYNQGYLSAKTGLSRNGVDADSNTCQIAIDVNRGNSGGPVFNSSGELIGIISTKQLEATGVVFAVKAKTLYQMVERLKDNDTSIASLKLPYGKSTIRNTQRTQQIQKLEPYVFMVKAYTR
jgi:S1-C subfamily serine protease